MDFNIITPMAVTDAELTASNIPEDDHPEWATGTAYGQGDKVISTVSHRVYESMQAANQGNDPLVDDGTWWLDLMATNRWQAFDNRRSNRAFRNNVITYSIVPNRDCDAISMFGVTAGMVRIEVWDGAVRIFDHTISMVNTDHVVSVYTYLFGGIVYSENEVINGFPGYIGHRIDVTITAPGAVARVGHIVLGRNNIIGRVMNQPGVQFISHSRKGYNEFGDEVLIKRGSTLRYDLALIVPSVQASRVMGIIAEIDGLATAFYTSGQAPDYGIQGLGFVDDHSQSIDIAGDAVFPLVMKTLK